MVFKAMEAIAGPSCFDGIVAQSLCLDNLLSCKSKAYYQKEKWRIELSCGLSKYVRISVSQSVRAQSETATSNVGHIFIMIM